MLSSRPAELLDRRARGSSCARAQNSSTASGSASGSTCVLDLAADAEQLAGGDEQPEVRAGLGQRGELAALPRSPARGCRAAGAALVRRCAPASSPFAPSVCATVSRTSAGSRSGGEPDPEDAGLELADELGRRLDRQPRLSRAARAGQRHEPRAVAQQRGDFADLPLTADERDAGRGRLVFEIVFSGGKRSSPSWKSDTGSPKSFSRCSPRSRTSTRRAARGSPARAAPGRRAPRS